MIAFILVVVKIVTSIFSISNFNLLAFTTTSPTMLIAFMVDDLSNERVSLKTCVVAVIFCLYLLVWIVVPWLLISKKRGIATTGFLLVIGTNLFDIISCIFTALPIVTKALNVFFCVLIIWFSIKAVRQINY